MPFQNKERCISETKQEELWLPLNQSFLFFPEYALPLVFTGTSASHPSGASAYLTD